MAPRNLFDDEDIGDEECEDSLYDPEEEEYDCEGEEEDDDYYEVDHDYEKEVEGSEPQHSDSSDDENNARYEATTHYRSKK